MPPKKNKNNKDLESRIEYAHHIRTLRNNTQQPKRKQEKKKKKKKDKE